MFIIPTRRRSLTNSAASPADGIHLDADQHEQLGNALAALMQKLPAFALSSE